MGKGFNSARNKQAELAKRMEAAKRQKNPDLYDSNEEPEEIKVSVDEQLQKDREEFAQLLSTSHLPKPEKKSVAMRSTLDQAAKDRAPTLSKSKGPKVNAKKLKKQKMKQAGGGSKGEEAEDVPLQQGDVARRRDFEHLVSTETSLQLGAIRAAQLVPWVPPYLSNFLVVVADPRSQSGDLHQTVQYLTSNLEPEMLAQVMVVTADSAAETVSWQKRAGLLDDETAPRIEIYSDNEKLDWMRSYSALVDDERWSMSVMVFCTRGIIQTLVRQVDPAKACPIVLEAIQKIEDEEV